MGREMLLFRGGNHTLLACKQHAFQLEKSAAVTRSRKLYLMILLAQ